MTDLLLPPDYLVLPDDRAVDILFELMQDADIQTVRDVYERYVRPVHMELRINIRWNNHCLRPHFYLYVSGIYPRARTSRFWPLLDCDDNHLQWPQVEIIEDILVLYHWTERNT